jgi:dihydrofolate reductase
VRSGEGPKKRQRRDAANLAATPRRRVRYRVVASLDGYIAGPNGELDWILHDPTLSFDSLYKGVDTVLLGRRTFELTQTPGAPAWPSSWKIYVFSRTLRPTSGGNVTFVRDNAGAAVAAMRSQPGLDIWLFGGGDLFASLLAAGVVDEVEVAVMPVLLGGGIPLFASRAQIARLRLTACDASALGIVTLRYDVVSPTG